MEHEPRIKSREQAFNYLNGYSLERIEELNIPTLKRPLIKTYLVETVAEGTSIPPITELFHDVHIRQLDEEFFEVTTSSMGRVGFLEAIAPRFLFFYTHREAHKMDRFLNRQVAESVYLDHVWLSGVFFNELWQTILAINKDKLYRRGKIRFEHKSIFEYPIDESGLPEEPDYPWTESDNSQAVFDDTEDNRLTEPRGSSLVFVEQLGKLDKVLPNLRNSYSPFYAISALRYPSAETKGGHDFYYFGKVTNRSDNFEEHRYHALDVVKAYGRITKLIEENIVYHSEFTHLASGIQSAKIDGAPVWIEFPEKLSQEVFVNFIVKTFERAQGPFKFSGSPIWLGTEKVHVYAIDMHLWQELFVEITPQYIMVLLPKGTCGNTLHRLVTNVQQYLYPQVNVSVGACNYDTLIHDNIWQNEDSTNGR